MLHKSSTSINVEWALLSSVVFLSKTFISFKVVPQDIDITITRHVVFILHLPRI